MNLYLTSIEYEDFKIPRKIIDYKNIKLSGRNVLVANVSEPLIGQDYGFGGTDIYTFYLVNKFDEYSFEKMNEFPIYVHVFIPKENPLKTPTALDELQNIAWARIYNDLEAARKFL